MNIIHKHLAKRKNNYKSNSILIEWYMTYSHKTKNTIIFREYRMNQICKIKTCHNHLTLNNKERFYINIYPEQITKNIDIEYKIKIKIICLKVIYQNQYTKIHYYSFNKSLIMLRSGDIEVNPGPMPNILETHPPPHRQRYKTYFITCTIKLQPEYQHLAKTFSPILK